MSSYSDSENESLMSFGDQSLVSSYSTHRSSSSSQSPSPVRGPSKTLKSKGQACSSKPSVARQPKGETTSRVPPSSSKAYTKPKPPPTIPSIKPVVPPRDSISEFLQRGLAPTVSRLAPLSIEPLDTSFPIEAPLVTRSPSPHTPQTTPPITPPLPSSPLSNSPSLERDNEHIFGDILASINQHQGLRNATIDEVLAEAEAIAEHATDVTNSAKEVLEETMRKAIELEMELELEERMNTSMSGHSQRPTDSHQSSDDPQVQPLKKRWLLREQTDHTTEQHTSTTASFSMREDLSRRSETPTQSSNASTFDEAIWDNYQSALSGNEKTPF